MYFQDSGYVILFCQKKGNESEDKITIPTSRTLSAEKTEKVREELNVPQKIQSIASRILEFKKQKRGIDKNITKLEKELEKIFDEMGTDEVEVQFGLLKRRKTESGESFLKSSLALFGRLCYSHVIKQRRSQ